MERRTLNRLARFCSCWVATWDASRQLQRSAAIFIACDTARQAAERSLHSGSVSSQVWRLSSTSRSPPTRQRGAAGGFEVIQAWSGNSPANLHIRLRRRSGAPNLERAVELARETFIPGWLGNLHLGLAELALDRNCFEDANILLEQAEAHYKNKHPKHLWGEIQVGLAGCRLMRAAGKPGMAGVSSCSSS